MEGDGEVNGNAYVPFAELMELAEVVAGSVYRSRSRAFAPGGGTTAYGGHVFAQAAWAASQTVGEGFLVHNVTGFFTLAGDTQLPFTYRVRTVREGRGFCTRGVDVVQEPEQGICFTCICSFKKEEPVAADIQDGGDLGAKYGAVLEDTSPEDWPEAPGVDSPWFWQSSKLSNYNNPFPGLSNRKVDMAAYNSSLPPFEQRQLHFYSVLGDLPPATQHPYANLHVAAHLYASDRNSLFLVPNFTNFGDDYTAMASLSHKVVLHAGAERLSVGDGQGRKKWFCQESWFTRANDGRALHESRLWSWSGGGRREKHVASTMQDGLVRFKTTDGEARLVMGKQRNGSRKAKARSTVEKL